MRRIGAITVGGQGYNFSEIAAEFGFVSRSVLFQTGLQASKQLYRDKLSGILNPRSFSGSGLPVSDLDNRMVRFSVSRDNKSVIVRSYPMNVYRAKGETGSRSTKRTAGKKIFRSFESGINLSEMAETALAYVLQNSKAFEPVPGEGVVK
jgi:hypothetical protein